MATRFKYTRRKLDGMSDFSGLQQKLLEMLRPTFPGPEITDALCNAEQLAAKYEVSLDDEEALEACVAEAIHLTLQEIRGEREHRCPER